MPSGKAQVNDTEMRACILSQGGLQESGGRPLLLGSAGRIGEGGLMQALAAGCVVGKKEV